MDDHNSFKKFLSGESTDAVCKVSRKSVQLPGGGRKSRFVTLCKFVKNNGKQKWAWPISHDSAQISEPVDTRSLNM